MEGALREKRRTRLEVGQDRAFVAAFESEAQVPGLARCAAPHLRRLVLVLGKFRKERTRQAAGNDRGDQRRLPESAHQAGCLVGSLRSNSKSSTMRSTSAGMPSPVRQLVNRNGLSPRISFESVAITSRLAPT